MVQPTSGGARRVEAKWRGRVAGVAAVQYMRRAGMKLPDIEVVSGNVHEAWMEAKRAAGVSSRKSETGEELMRPYDELSEAAKERDRATVKAVHAAIKAVGEAPPDDGRLSWGAGTCAALGEADPGPGFRVAEPGPSAPRFRGLRGVGVTRFTLKVFLGR